MTGTDYMYFTHKSVPVIFEPLCILDFSDISGWGRGITMKQCIEFKDAYD